MKVRHDTLRANSRRLGGVRAPVGPRRFDPRGGGGLLPHPNPKLGGSMNPGANTPSTFHGPIGSSMKGPNPSPGNFVPRVNPNSLLEQGGIGQERNPLQHLDWWAQHGWDFRNGRFVNPGGHLMPLNSQGGRPNPANPSGGGGHHGNGGGGGGGRRTGGPHLPLDPQFEAQRRLLEDQLQASLSPLRAAHDQVLASNGLQQARLDTNQGVDTDSLLNSLAARGIFGSGIQNHDMGQLATDYLRQNQDLANATAGSLGDIASQRSAARLAYNQGLQEALLASAQRSNADKYAVAPMGGGRRRKQGKHNGRHGGRRH